MIIMMTINDRYSNWPALLHTLHLTQRVWTWNETPVEWYKESLETCCQWDTLSIFKEKHRNAVGSHMNKCGFINSIFHECHTANAPLHILHDTEKSRCLDDKTSRPICASFHGFLLSRWGQANTRQSFLLVVWHPHTEQRGGGGGLGAEMVLRYWKSTCASVWRTAAQRQCPAADQGPGWCTC